MISFSFLRFYFTDILGESDSGESSDDDDDKDDEDEHDDENKGRLFFFLNLLNAQSSLCRNGGHSVITELVAFISNKMKYIFFFFNRRWEDGNYWSHWNKPCCFAKNNISHNSVQVLYVAKFNTHIENLDNNWQVIATICIDKLKWPSGFTGKLHFLFSVVK